MEPREMDVLSDSKEILGNRTGIMTNPELSIELIEGAKQTVPSSQGDATELASVRSEYIEEGVPIGSSPVMVEVSENGESVGPVQNFRWNMSPIVGYNNLTLVGKPVPMHTGESYDGLGTALVPPVRIEEFYMTSVSPAL